MLQTEFIRHLNCNYERLLLNKKPEENRYQYCIVGRGGIKGLLPCSLRYINGVAYLYYDISSTQSISQLHERRKIDREWVKALFWGIKQVKQEMGRFLLDDSNLIWYPEHIFQDLERKVFYFLYIPYYEGECGFRALLDYLVEHIDYEDEVLVEGVYSIHEQYEAVGESYLQEQIFIDVQKMDDRQIIAQKEENTATNERKIDLTTELTGDTTEKPRKGIRYFLDGRKKKQEERILVRQQNVRAISSFAVAEDSVYRVDRNETKDDEEEMGRTIYMEEKEEEIKAYRLYAPEGRIICTLNEIAVIIGKKKGEADCILTDNSVSRLHARITKENGEFYLEDLNSTNGTFKNGLQLQPYEKRKLQEEDEIRLGKVVLIFR